MESTVKNLNCFARPLLGTKHDEDGTNGSNRGWSARGRKDAAHRSTSTTGVHGGEAELRLGFRATAAWRREEMGRTSVAAAEGSYARNN